jgi:leucine dehydrogenase
MLFDARSYDNHEKVVFCRDPQAGLSAIIAIHSTTLGPAAGGCRMFPYASDAEALDDVLRLSRSMTYKNALAGLPLGGGKSVVIADPGTEPKAARLEAFGRCVETLGGAYWTAEDIGVNLDAVEIIGRRTKHVFGTRSGACATGDPSAFTARGVLAGLAAAVRHRLKRADLAGVRVAVQGVGAVGWEICAQLKEQGAVLVVADRDDQRAANAAAVFGADVEATDRIHASAVDVFAPCATVGVLDVRTVAELKAKVVCGAANNPLATRADGVALKERGVLYAPDFVVNAGGMMHASGEIFGRHDAPAVLAKIDAIAITCQEIFRRAEAEQALPEDIALDMAKARIAAA